MTLRSRSGKPSCSVSRMIIVGVGRERPVSTKLRWRIEMSARMARSSWLSRRRSRYSRSSSPTVRSGRNPGAPVIVVMSRS
ncbi:MAG TPA: hypothetical protein VIJ82_09935 [Streptosporangiaceae bacterium]